MHWESYDENRMKLATEGQVLEGSDAYVTEDAWAEAGPKASSK